MVAKRAAKSAGKNDEASLRWQRLEEQLKQAGLLAERRRDVALALVERLEMGVDEHAVLLSNIEALLWSDAAAERASRLRALQVARGASRFETWRQGAVDRVKSPRERLARVRRRLARFAPSPVARRLVRAEPDWSWFFEEAFGGELDLLRRGFSSSAPGGPIFDLEWYVAQTGRHATSLDPIGHYLYVGALAAISPCRLFDIRYYIGQSDEVARSGVDPLWHYLTHGWRMGLDPHPLFRTDWYLMNSPDVAATGINPLVHYLARGAGELRSPHPLIDPQWQLETLSPEAAKGGALAQLTAGETAPGPHFDPVHYSAAANLNPGESPLAHYLTIGAWAGVEPKKRLDIGAYMARWPDSVSGSMTALEHMVMWKRTPPRRGLAKG